MSVSPPLHGPGTPQPGSDGSTGRVPRRCGLQAVGELWLWGWLGVVHLGTDLLLSVPFLAITALTCAALASLPALGAGAPLLVLTLALGMGLGVLERMRLHALTGVRLTPLPPPSPEESWWRRLLLDPRPWKAAAYLLVIALWGLVAGTAVIGLTCVALALATLPLYRGHLPGNRVSLPWGGDLDAASWPWLGAAGAAALLVVPLIARALVTVDVAIARVLLGRSLSEEVRELSERVQTLTETRVATVDSVEAERRRIERDLHDGPQQRLVAIAMNLGMARAKLAAAPVEIPAGVQDLLDAAHVSAKEAIVEMRQVARGIAPPVLTDRGLDAALSALAARSPVPVTVTARLAERPPPTVEAIAYFCVSEALTNVAKHSRARTARVEVGTREGMLTLVIVDDGVGGAVVGGGTGLVGLCDRIQAIDGTLDVSSPPGGPTALTVCLPLRMPERRPVDTRAPATRPVDTPDSLPGSPS